MFHKFYNTGRGFVENTLPAWVNKISPHKSAEDKTYAAGVAGIAAGDFFEKTGYAGMALTFLAAAVVGFSSVLTVPSLLTFLAVGTGLAFVGTFGKGMKDKGNDMSGLLDLSRELSSPLTGFAAEKFKNWRQPKAAGAFKAAANPAPEQATTPVPVTAPAAAPAQKI